VRPPAALCKNLPVSTALASVLQEMMSIARSSRPRPRTLLRLAVSVSAGAVAAILTIFLGNWKYAPAIGWDTTAVIFCGWTWRAIWPLSADQTADRATAEDPNRAVGDIIMLSAAAASLAGLGLVLVATHATGGATQVLLALLAIASVALSWFSVHTIFTLRYALLYYSEPVGGISFNQQERPDYHDFAYVALTIGMTFQVSDTNLETSPIRGTALRHALLSYLFGAVILAATVNLIASLGSSSSSSGGG